VIKRRCILRCLSDQRELKPPQKQNGSQSQYAVAWRSELSPDDCGHLISTVHKSMRRCERLICGRRARGALTPTGRGSHDACAGRMCVNVVRAALECYSCIFLDLPSTALFRVNSRLQSIHTAGMTASHGGTKTHSLHNSHLTPTNFALANDGWIGGARLRTMLDVILAACRRS